MAQASKSSKTKPRSSSKSRSPQRKAASNRRPKSTSAAGQNGVPSKLGSAGETVAEAASKAKTPLIAGGAAVAGAVGGVLVKNRINASRGPMQKLRRVSLPRPSRALTRKFDLGTVRSTAERVGSLSQQAADIAAAAEKTRKKNN
jgi:hypothetical protein